MGNLQSQKYARKFTYPTKYLDIFCKYLMLRDKILDIGCGPGQNCRHLYNKGFYVEGIDSSEHMIKHARLKAPLIPFTKMDMRELSFDDQTFNGIISTFSLMYISHEQQIQTITKFSKILKNEGLIYLAIHIGNGTKTLEDPLTANISTLNLFTKK